MYASVCAEKTNSNKYVALRGKLILCATAITFRKLPFHLLRLVVHGSLVTLALCWYCLHVSNFEKCFIYVGLKVRSWQQQKKKPVQLEPPRHKYMIPCLYTGGSFQTPLEFYSSPITIIKYLPGIFLFVCVK